MFSFPCLPQNQTFSLVSHSCRLFSTDVTLARTRVACVSIVTHSCCSCNTRVALVTFVSHSCRSSCTRVARLLVLVHLCCKIGYTKFKALDKNLKKEDGLYEIEAIDNLTVITIALNSKECFEKFRNRDVNQKHTGL